jgi:hypothetical protein
MDARAFYQKHGRKRCVRVAEKSGTTIGYFMQIACGHRRPSPELADEFVRHSGGEMDLMSLLRLKRRAA